MSSIAEVSPSGFNPWPITEEMYECAREALGVMHLNREEAAKVYIAMRASEKEVCISDTELLDALGYLLSVARASHIDVEDIAYAETVYAKYGGYPAQVRSKENSLLAALELAEWIEQNYATCESHESFRVKAYSKALRFLTKVRSQGLHRNRDYGLNVCTLTGLVERVAQAISDAATGGASYPDIAVHALEVSGHAELLQAVRLFVEKYDAADENDGVAVMLAYNDALEAGQAALAKVRGES